MEPVSEHLTVWSLLPVSDPDGCLQADQSYPAGTHRVLTEITGSRPGHLSHLTLYHPEINGFIFKGLIGGNKLRETKQEPISFNIKVFFNIISKALCEDIVVHVDYFICVTVLAQMKPHFCCDVTSGYWRNWSENQ